MLRLVHVSHTNCYYRQLTGLHITKEYDIKTNHYELAKPGYYLQLEQFSMECRKTKTKPITYKLDYSTISNRSKTKIKSKVIVSLLLTLNWNCSWLINQQIAIYP